MGNRAAKLPVYPTEGSFRLDGDGVKADYEKMPEEGDALKQKLLSFFQQHLQGM